jgi:hypothetical protein
MDVKTMNKKCGLMVTEIRIGLPSRKKSLKEERYEGSF